MKLYFAGAEVSSHRKLLANNEVEYVSMSYMGLRRRVKFARPWMIADHFPAEQKVFLDSGAYTVNKDQDADQDEVADIAAHYMAFALQNIGNLDMVSEFDAAILGQDWIEAMRKDFWSNVPRDKFLPIWHESSGVDVLQSLAGQYPRIGILQGDIGGRDLTPLLNELAAAGTRFHGVAMTKMEPMREIRWDSVGSTSWLSPTQYGDTFVWDGRKLIRYPKARKDAARKRHASWFRQNGFDDQAIQDDTVSEVQRLSIWSWQQFVDDINKGRVLNPFATGGVVTEHDEEEIGDNSEHGGMAVANPQSGTPNEKLAVAIPEKRETQLLPIIGVTTERVTVKDDKGEETEQEVVSLQSRSDSMRQCNTCSVKDVCPGMKPNANCLYNIPIFVETTMQLKALRDGIISMQTQRVMFMMMQEQLKGGYADPNTSSEIDRLRKLIKDRVDAEREGFSMTVQAHGPAGSGVISNIMGREVADKMNELPDKRPADEELGEVFDAEWTEGSN